MKTLIIFLFISTLTFAQDTTYTVKWTLVEVLPARCQDLNQESEYGITNNYGTACAVLHIRIEQTEMQKEFNTEKEADEFIKNMPLENVSGMTLGSHCENPIKIKNIKQ